MNKTFSDCAAETLSTRQGNAKHFNINLSINSRSIFLLRKLVPIGKVDNIYRFKQNKKNLVLKITYFRCNDNSYSRPGVNFVKALTLAVFYWRESANKIVMALKRHFFEQHILSNMLPI